jgi:nitroreductase
MLDEIISQRRSVRKFKNKPVPRELIDKCIEAARLAPSACNSQPWHYVVFDDKEAKTKFEDVVFTGVYAGMKKLAAGAPVLIAVVAKTLPDATTSLGQIISGTKFYLIDQGIATEHLVLKAHELGLGTCWVGWFDNKKAKKALGLALTAAAHILIALGYPDESPEPRARKKFEEIVSYNKYG